MVDKRKRKAMSMDIAQRLAAMRRDKGFSQEELAAQLGLSRQAISKWERGESAPDMGNLLALADLYEVTLDELIRGEAPAAATSSESAAASEKVGVTINTFINDEKTKATEPAAPEAPAKVTEVPCATPATAPAPAAAAPVPVAAPPACPPPAPQSAPVMVGHCPQATPPTSVTPKVATEVWMTFPYPLFCALLYLVLGFMFGLWHPGWVLFLTIPFFYWIVRVVKNDPNYIAAHSLSAEQGSAPNEVKLP